MPFFAHRNCQEYDFVQEQLVSAVKRKIPEKAIVKQLTTGKLSLFLGSFFCHKSTCYAWPDTLFNLLTIPICSRFRTTFSQTWTTSKFFPIWTTQMYRPMFLQERSMRKLREGECNASNASKRRHFF